MMKKLIIGLFLSLIITLGFSQSWSQQFDFSAPPRSSATGFSNGNYGYLCGGSLDNITHYNELWQYDPTIDRWFSRASFPGTARRNLISFTIDSLSYVGLGYNYSNNQIYNDMFVYNPNSDSWLQIATFPGSATRGSSAITHNGKGYVVGGTLPRGTIAPTNHLYEYNPINNTWTQRANFPGGARSGGVTFSSDSAIYFGLGHNHSTAFNDLWAYSPNTNVWRIVDSFPGVARHNASAFLVNGKAIVGGGLSVMVTLAHQDYYSYDMAQDSWTLIPNFTNGRRATSAAFTIGNKAYLVTGLDSLANALKDVWKYTDTTLVTNLNKESKAEFDLSVYPNPTQGIINFKNTSGRLLNASILNVRGQKVRSFSINGISDYNVDISDLSKGLYFYHVIGEEGQYSGKIILNN
jgi:N-acetylneuraminic acid mutarotase